VDVVRIPIVVRTPQGFPRRAWEPGRRRALGHAHYSRSHALRGNAIAGCVIRGVDAGKL
jgi:hypothetical protein